MNHKLRFLDENHPLFPYIVAPPMALVIYVFFVFILGGFQ